MKLSRILQSALPFYSTPNAVKPRKNHKTTCKTQRVPFFWDNL